MQLGYQNFHSPPKPAPPSQSFTWVLVDPKCLKLYNGNPTQSCMLRSPRDFEHLHLRAFFPCVGQDYGSLRYQAQWLNSNQKSKATGLLSQFPQQTQVTGFYSQRSRLSCKCECSFTGAQCIHVVRLAGPAHEDTKEIYVDIFISISHSLIQQIHITQCHLLGVCWDR